MKLRTASAVFALAPMARALQLVMCLTVLGVGTAAECGPLIVAGSPGFDPDTYRGLKDGEICVAPGWGVNDSGTAVGWAGRYDGYDNWMGDSAVRWDGSGMSATELCSLGSDSSASARAYAINNAGTAVGYADKYENGSYKGYCAVRWDGSGTTATELANLGTWNGYNNSVAVAINDAGAIAGYASKVFDGYSKGYRAVRWDASGTVATELGVIGTNSSGSTSAYANAMNNAGTVVGWAYKYAEGSDLSLGTRAVRWDYTGTVATELGNLGTDSTGSAVLAEAVAVNNGGTAVGYAPKYVDGSLKGTRAVRWDASGTVATELGILGTYSDGTTYSQAYALNDAGTAVGWVDKYVDGSRQGNRAVRWDYTGTVATELGNLGFDWSSQAYAINNAGTAVGNVGSAAVIWLPDASAIDLNSLGVVSVPTDGTWSLCTAKSLSADGWVSGEAMFIPDSNPSTWYTRLYVTQVGLGGTWIKAEGGTWGRGPNWSTGTPAMQVGNAVFNLSAAYAVGLDRNESTKTIAIDAGAVTLQGNGHTLATESGMSIAAGATLLGEGELTLGGTIVNQGQFTAEAGAHIVCLGDIIGDGAMTVAGDAELWAGNIAQNTLSIDGSGKVATAPSGLSSCCRSFASQTVPEPHALILLVGSALVFLTWRRQGGCESERV
jgi:hypothetical protein